jgi:NAD(P)-dependent dehydrogenase (short-subunit alcohol dehydrogenase family)
MSTTTFEERQIAHRRLSGTFIVSGAASGLGLAVAESIRTAGGLPVSFDLRTPPDSLEHRAVDIADTAAVEDAVRSVAATHGPLAGVVANAGIDACGSFSDVPAQDWERVIRVNLIGTAALVRAALPHMIEHGHIVTVASTLGLRALSEATAYCASKFGVVGFTRALARELSPRFSVTLLIPGGMQTHFFDGRDERYKPAADAVLNRPESVADAVVFALSQPRGCEVRELLICPSGEPSWP